MAPVLTRHVYDGVTLLGDDNRPGGVTLAFTERTGGVSRAPYASLNLGSRCGDDAAAVAKNRALALAAMGAASIAANLVEPKQVHGDHVVVVRRAAGAAAGGHALGEHATREGAATLAAGQATLVDAARAEALAGADAIVCTVPGVPVLLCFADCVPVVLAAPRAFAVIHSGWRGTLARISAKALGILCEEAVCEPADVVAYIGPHISGEDYEVSPELLATFTAEFGPCVELSGMPRHLNLAAAITTALAECGLPSHNICCVRESTASHLDRFYSYRAEEGTCGRHAAIAFL